MSAILSTRLQALYTAVEAGDHTALSAFWRDIEAQGTPVVERAAEGQCYVTFLWRGDESTKAVDVIQDWGADGIREHLMKCLPGTNVWYKTRLMPSDTRTTYQLAPEPLPAPLAGRFPLMPDPLNPKHFSPFFDESGFQIVFSLLELPDAPALGWMHDPPARGTVILHTPFEDGRRIWVYLPASAPPCSLLIAFDGRLAKDLIGLPQMLDARITAREMCPTVALMLDNPNRDELACQPEFADYVAQQVLPWAQANFPVTRDPAQTVISGSSYGGLCAAYVGLRHAEAFGAVLSQTGWFRWHPDDDAEHEWLARQFAAEPRKPLRFYLDVGVLENAAMSDGGPTQRVCNRHLRDVLRAKGYPVMYREYSGGHDCSSTQRPLYDALPLLLPPQAAAK